MSNIWDALVELETLFEEKFDKSGTRIEHDEVLDCFNNDGWVNISWSSDLYRRAHIAVVDTRKTKGLWMMHCCIFPHIHNSGPIFGFDIIAGKNKITGFFHDFSPTVDENHELIKWFSDSVSVLEWHKKRELPEWAKPIFSQSIITASNVQSEHELDQIIKLAENSIDHYLESICETNNTIDDNTQAQNFYVGNQKLNPHNPRVLINLGMSEKDVELFIDKSMFPSL